MDRGSCHCMGGSDQYHPQEKEMQKGKQLSEEALKIAEKRDVKGKGEKERYTHLNAEFQRTARRDKKAFLSDQCKEIEENQNGKLELSQENQKYQGNAKMGTIKDRTLWT